MHTTQDLSIKEQVTKGCNMIDLGLLSGTLWCDRNLGSPAAEKYGNYYRFGEISSVSQNYSTYELTSLTNIAGTEFDASTLNLGAGYHIPTFDQIDELIDYCQWEWTRIDNTAGFLITGPNGAKIFLPASGYTKPDSNNPEGMGIFGFYWTDLHSQIDFCTCMNFHQNRYTWDCFHPDFGFQIRPVKDK